MQAVTNFFLDKFNIFSTLSLWDAIDIAIVAYIIYKAIMLIRKTNSYNLAKGIVYFLIALWVSGVLELTMINYLLKRAVEIGLIALVILFQPELRKLLARVGSGNFKSLFSSRAQNISEIERAITQTVMACESMSSTKTGALIIFERGITLNETMSTGTLIDAGITAELLKNIFYPKAPLHDGALIIREARIAAAGCVLPLTTSTNLSKDLGMRHRAGIGISEQSDAIVVIVSEETGGISVAYNGMLKRNLNRETFEAILRNELVQDEDTTNTGKKLFDFIRSKGAVKNNETKDSDE